ncbi:MAG: polyphosphate kinase 1 [Saprospiraceae bacterium]|nr:polyphosphate kinase 1 [Saprospiraceae bacterium]
MELDYIKRDVSWLSFNHRVLQEAKDPSVPLYERIKFLAIYSSNLDEFFRVRVASLRSFKELKKKTRKQLDLKPKRELKVIRKEVQAQQKEFGKIFRKEILPSLENLGIHLITDEQYNDSQKEQARKFFFEKLYPNLNPIIVREGEEAPFLKNKGLYFIIQFRESTDIGIVEIPADKVARFHVFKSEEEHHYVSFIDDIIRLCLAQLFDRSIEAAYSIKVSRDAELYIGDEYSGDLIEKIRNSLDNRNVGLPTRFLYDSSMPKEFLNLVKTLFGLSKHDIIPGARYHNFNDFFGFPDPTNSTELHDQPMPPLPHPELETADSIIGLLQEKDVLLSFPYQKYDYIPKMVLEAADDPDVKTIKITLYRVADKSAVVQALLYALEKGKKVVAFIEAKARFDEASNLYWGEELKKAKAKVYFSYPGIKVHTKLLLISRKEEEKTVHYAYLGTGNFNEKTAKLYCDHALLTSDQRLAKEVNFVFKLLEKKIIQPECTHVLVAPFNLRTKFETLIDKEISNAQKGKDAYMILKMNSLEDQGMIDKLYQASQAGVKIQLIIRGICCLIPGVQGMSENIKVMSIVDRFLEHARVYIFANSGQELIYCASADWMTRNLYRRVEVAFPIYQKEIKEEIRTIINLQLQDNTKARIIDENQSNKYILREKDTPPQRAQIEIYKRLKSKIQ